MASKKQGGENKRLNYGITSQLDADHFRGYSDAELLPALDAAKGGDAAPLGELLCSRIEDAGAKVQDFHIVVHDSDVYTLDDALANSSVKVGDAKPPHFHAVGHAPSEKDSLTISAIADAVGMAEQAVVLPQTRGRYAHENMLAYMCHSNAPKKHQYAPERVATVRGFDFHELWDEKHAKWEASGKKQQAKTLATDGYDILMARVRDGMYATETEIKEDPAMADVWVSLRERDRREIRGTLEAVASVHVARMARAINDNLASKTVIWASGRHGGDGKTNMFMGLFKALHHKRGWHFDTLTCGRDPFGDYHGAEMVLLDDLRPTSDIAPEDLLLALDNYHASPAGARYHNQPTFPAYVVCITSMYTPVEFWRLYVKEKAQQCTNEQYDQLMRRITIWSDFVDIGEEFPDLKDDACPYNVKVYTSRRVEGTAKPVREIAGANSWGDYGDAMCKREFVRAAPDDFNAPNPIATPPGVAGFIGGVLYGRSLWREEVPDLPVNDLERACLEAAYQEYQAPIKKGEFHALPDPSKPQFIDESIIDFGHRAGSLGTHTTEHPTPLWWLPSAEPVDPGTLDIECEIVEEVEA